MARLLIAALIVWQTASCGQRGPLELPRVAPGVSIGALA